MDLPQQGRTTSQGNGFHDRIWRPAVERTWPSLDESGYLSTSRAVPILRPRIHDLRHTCASWLVLAGVPLPVVQQHLGHESINTTISLYAHIDRQSMQTAADVIGRALGGRQPSEGARSQTYPARNRTIEPSHKSVFGPNLNAFRSN